MGKVGVAPAVFNISEPMVFGTPIMFNPILDIPFVLNTMTALIVWGGYTIGFFKPGYVLLLSVLPIGMREFLSSMSWHTQRAHSRDRARGRTCGACICGVLQSFAP